MGPVRASCLTRESEQRSLLDLLAFFYVQTAHMGVESHHPGSVVKDDRIACKEEVLSQYDLAGIGGSNASAYLCAKVDPVVVALQLAVKDPSCTVDTRHFSRHRNNKWQRPEFLR